LRGHHPVCPSALRLAHRDRAAPARAEGFRRLAAPLDCRTQLWLARSLSPLGQGLRTHRPFQRGHDLPCQHPSHAQIALNLIYETVSKMFSVAERERARARVLELAASDPRVVAGAVVGSLALSE